MEVKFIKGCYMLVIPKKIIEKQLDQYYLTVPGNYEEARLKRDGENYHMTLIPSKEKPEKLEIPQLENFDFLTLALGKTKKSYHLICHYPEGDRIRKILNLPIYDFHITLGFNKTDDHKSPKDLTSFYKPYLPDMNRLLFFKTTSRIKWLNILDRMIKLDIYKMTDYEEYEWWYYYVTGWANVQKFDKVDMYLPHLIDIEPFMGYYIRLKINKITKQLTPQDISTAYEAIKDKTILSKYMKEIGELVVLLNDDVGVDLKRKYVIEDDKIVPLVTPRNLTRIIVPKMENDMTKLYGAGMITCNHVDFIKNMGFDMILNLTEHVSPIQKKVPEIYYHIPIEDRTPPSMNQMYSILNEMDKYDKVIVHCIGGKGRTNTIIVAYLVWKLGIYVSHAMKCIQNRSYAFSDSQLEFLKDFEKHERQIKKIKDIKIGKGIKPHVIMLVGLPCSGKSTLSEHLQKQIPENIIRLNQDEMGRGQYYKKLISTSEKISKSNSKFMLIDKCNTTTEERKFIIDLSKKYKLKSLCLWLDISIDELMLRAKQRKDHPVLSAGKTADVIKEKNKKLEIPDIKEGFTEIIHIRDEAELNMLLELWSLEPINMYESGYFKFPRTCHLYSLGSASRNDLLITKEEEAEFLKNEKVYVEEKIDGANLGISIDKSDMSIKFQNRSHYVTSATHQQFSKLDKWTDTYGNQLYDILEAGRHILFGEWLYLKHTIPYKELPSYFVAFDMYDKKEKKFYARKRLKKILSETSIPLVPMIYTGKLGNKKNVIDLLNRDTEYGDSQMEGIYIKIPDDNDEYIIKRGKVVRNDFLDDDADFWTKDTKPNELNGDNYV